MYKDQRILAFIGARAGSSGLPGKNLREFSGEPLLYWSIHAAQASRYVDEVLVSSDSNAIVDFAKACKAQAPFLRPAELSTDSAQISDALMHGLDWLAAENNEQFDAVLMLQPTSPLRTEEHIDEAIEHYFNHRQQPYTSLISVSQASQKSAWLMQIDEDYIRFCFKQGDGDLARQNNPTFYLPNGAIYFSKVDELRQKHFNQHHLLYYKMRQEDSIDIDTLDEFEQAQSLFRQRTR